MNRAYRWGLGFLALVGSYTAVAEPLINAAVAETQVEAAPITKAVGPQFVLASIELTGSEVAIPPAAKSLIAFAISKPINFQQLQELTAKIEESYRQAGWTLNQVIIPHQSISAKNAKIQLRVLDGYIHKVVLLGDTSAASNEQFRRYISQIVHLRPFNYNTAKHYLVLANDIPGLEVRANIQADLAHEAPPRLQVLVKRRPVVN